MWGKVNLIIYISGAFGWNNQALSYEINAFPPLVCLCFKGRNGLVILCVPYGVSYRI